MKCQNLFSGKKKKKKDFKMFSAGIVVQKELEKVQNRATRFVTGNYNFETGSMTSILEQLGWESLHKRCKGSKLILLFKGLKGRAIIPCDYLQPPYRRSRNQHPIVWNAITVLR